jgi:hypothetical protein
MKVAQLRQLRQLALGMRSASSANQVEWYARAIARVIENLENPSATEPLEKAPPDGERIGTAPCSKADTAPGPKEPSAAPRGIAEAHTATDRKAAIAQKPSIGAQHVSRETRARQPNDRHPIFLDDPAAIADQRRGRTRFSY